MSGFTLRLARPEELSELIRIDDEACSLFTELGMPIELDPNDAFLSSERARWRSAVEQRLAHVAVDATDEPLGFAVLGFVDSAPYLDQLSVRPRAMRRGIGRALIQRALEWSAERPLWLTTYARVPWNAPYYERLGFVRVPDSECSPAIEQILDEQRRALPPSDERVAMVHRPAS